MMNQNGRFKYADLQVMNAEAIAVPFAVSHIQRCKIYRYTYSYYVYAILCGDFLLDLYFETKCFCSRTKGSSSSFSFQGIEMDWNGR
jgi:hypothetical protein